MLGHDKIRLDENELTDINGGAGANGTNSQDKSNAYETHMCPHCNKKTTFKMYSGGRGICVVCNTPL